MREQLQYSPQDIPELPSRRYILGQFCRWGLIGVSVLTSGGVLQLIRQGGVQPDDKPLSNIIASSLLRATAVAAMQKEEQVSFEPEGEFSRDLFDQVRKSTYAVDVMTDKGIGTGTGWCAHKEGNNVYIVTNRHVTNLGDREDVKAEAVNIWRPSMDKQKINPLRAALVVMREYDLAILKCELRQEQAQSVEPLYFQDGAKIKKGERLLVVGFPMEFRETAKDEQSFLTSGRFVVVDEDINRRDHVWHGRALTDVGDSGSPVVIPDEQGNPIVVGMIFGRQRSVSVMYGISLSIDPLIQYLRNI